MILAHADNIMCSWKLIISTDLRSTQSLWVTHQIKALYKAIANLIPLSIVTKIAALVRRYLIWQGDFGYTSEFNIK
ncbi:hypothetical protein NIES25_42260 [Nostoc linckia NIES-25]|nr:hypothetical protein NIES25_42260 [Nostoc linckia NIES-25]